MGEGRAGLEDQHWRRAALVCGGVDGGGGGVGGWVGGWVEAVRDGGWMDGWMGMEMMGTEMRTIGTMCMKMEMMGFGVGTGMWDDFCAEMRF